MTHLWTGKAHRDDPDTAVFVCHFLFLCSLSDLKIIHMHKL